MSLDDLPDDVRNEILELAQRLADGEDIEGVEADPEMAEILEGAFTEGPRIGGDDEGDDEPIQAARPFQESSVTRKRGQFAPQGQGEPGKGKQPAAGKPAPAHDPEQEERYRDALLKNASKSRTFRGIVDTSASKAKASLMHPSLGKMQPEQIAKQARANFESAFAVAANAARAEFKSPQQIVNIADQINKAMGRNLVAEGVLMRQDDSTKFPYTKAKDLPIARQQFAQEFMQRIDSRDPIETAAWVQFRVNMLDHWYADGVGRTADMLAAAVLMRHGRPLPREVDTKEWYKHAPTVPVDPRSPKDYTNSEQWNRWLSFYRSLFSGQGEQATQRAQVHAGRPFDESKVNRGKKGTKEGGEFQKKGAGGTPTAPKAVVGKQRDLKPQAGKRAAKPQQRPAAAKPQQPQQPKPQQPQGKQRVEQPQSKEHTYPSARWAHLNEGADGKLLPTFGALGRSLRAGAPEIPVQKLMDSGVKDSLTFYGDLAAAAGAEMVERGPPGAAYPITAERAKLHDRWDQRVMEGHAPVAEGERPVARILGGGPSAGKTSMTRQETVGPNKGPTVNPDDGKRMSEEFWEARAAGGKVEKRAGAFMHEESSSWSKALWARLMSERYNATLDGTGDGTLRSLKKKVDVARKAGALVQAVYATVPADVALARAKKRGEQEGSQGVVPEAVIRGAHRAVSRVFPQALRAGFFDEAILYDTDVPWGSPPVLILTHKEGKTTIHDQKRWQVFLDKGNEIVARGKKGQLATPRDYWRGGKPLKPKAKPKPKPQA